MTKFDDAFSYVIDNEKGLNTDPDDRGGITNWGISTNFIKKLKDDDLLLEIEEKNSGLVQNEFRVKYLRENESIADGMTENYVYKLVPLQAKWIYQKYFWLPIYDQIENQDICNYILDMTVQHGKEKAAELVQRAINAYKWHYGYVKVDGVIGIITLTEINDCLPLRFIPFMIAVRESLFRCIVAHDNTQEKFLERWLKRCYK